MTRTIVLATLLAGIALPASAGVAYFQTPLFASEEVGPPVVPSDATGFARLYFDSDASTLRVSLTVDGLVGTLADGHIRSPAPFGVNTGVSVGFPGLPLGSRSFSYETTLDLLNTATYRAAFLAANGGTAAGARDALITHLSTGLAYVNVHSTSRPAGEIRGQVEVPAPAALALFGLGTAALGLIRRR